MRGIATYLILLIGIAVVSESYAQRTCGTEEYFQKSLKANPSLLQQKLDARKLSDQWLNAHPNEGAKKSGTILKIPVVVHVIYENPTENISDAQVLSQIEVLNDDFRKMNADTGDVPMWFKPVAADVEVEFILAVRDPNGDPTNGITRTATTVTSFGGANPKSTAGGGKDGWPNSDYLNFWVCDLGGGLLGYATFPGGNPSDDGVVCGYQYVGKPPSNTFGGSFNEGRTATHEVAHYLGLSHTFQGGCGGNSPSTCGFSGDGICDTPPTSSSNYGCPATKNTCTETPTDENDMTMNYMDYVNDACMNLFTDDQKARMRSVIQGSRPGLLTSLGGIPASALDASIAMVVPSDTICGADQITPVINLYNYGSTTLTSTTISYQLDGGTVSDYAWTGNLATLSSEDITLPTISTSLGSHTFKAWSSLPNGQADELASNDTSLSSFVFQDGNTVSLTLNYGGFQLANLVTWDIQTDSGIVVSSGGGYDENTTTIEAVCLEPGCYTFNLTDPPDLGQGDFTLVDITGDTIIAENDILTYTFDFCISAPPLATQELRDLNNLITLYPNPSNGLIKIRTGLPEGSIQTIHVQNTVGQTVLVNDRPKALAGYSELDLGFLDRGIYFITIRTSDNSITKKVSLIK